MKARYHVIVTQQAEADLESLTRYIAETVVAPLSAKRYIEQLREYFVWLEEFADILPIQPDSPLYDGFPMRRINYKNVAIIYTILGDKVYIYRIVAQSLITY